MLVWSRRRLLDKHDHWRHAQARTWLAQAGDVLSWVFFGPRLSVSGALARASIVQPNNLPSRRQSPRYCWTRHHQQHERCQMQRPAADTSRFEHCKQCPDCLVRSPRVAPRANSNDRYIYKERDYIESSLAKRVYPQTAKSQNTFSRIITRITRKNFGDI